MRQPNYKVGWFVPNHVLALTHFHADVTQDDFMGVIRDGLELTKPIDQEFQILVDNRAVHLPSLVSLSQMQQMAPFLSHPFLRWVVVVKPESFEDMSAMPVETEGHVRLKNVASLQEAIDFLQTIIPEHSWKSADPTFFPNTDPS